MFADRLIAGRTGGLSNELLTDAGKFEESEDEVDFETFTRAELELRPPSKTRFIVCERLLRSPPEPEEVVAEAALRSTPGSTENVAFGATPNSTAVLVAAVWANALPERQSVIESSSPVMVVISTASA